ncbi:MAG TPA: hypothetical protein VJT13_16420 [Xanthobacteraceae bacterium]|nr:hypothetical protein [Xanthobacteraceae bacterium]
MSRRALTNRRTLLSLAAATGALLPAAGSAFATSAHMHLAANAIPAGAKAKVRSDKTSQTAAVLRDLWVGHIFWIRTVAAGIINKQDAAAKVAEQQAVENAKSIAATIEPFYGAAAKDSFFKLLAGHYGAVKAYLVATVAGDATAQSKATQSLTSNANEIADFLSKANPYLSKDALQALLLAHGGHHIAQIQQLKDGNYKDEAQTWDEMKSHVYQIADATAEALAKQFAKKFA